VNNLVKSSPGHNRDNARSITPKQCEEQTRVFLRELGRGLPGDERVMVGYASEVTTKQEPGKPRHAGWWPEPYKEGKYIKGESNAYVCISSSIKTLNPRTGEMRFWREEASFGHGLALLIDDIAADEGAGLGSKGTLTLNDFIKVLPPTALVETSPGNHQVFYMLDKPEPNREKFKAFLYAFAAHVLKDGGDRTVKDVSRYGRMPCGVNGKRLEPDGPYRYPTIDAKGRTVPFRVSLKAADYSKRYSVAAIAAAFGVTIRLPKPKPELTEAFDGSEFKINEKWLEMAVKTLSATQGELREKASGGYRIVCPWGHKHSGGQGSDDAYIRGPKEGTDVDFVFHCSHNVCDNDHKRKWADFVDEVVMPDIIEELESINKRNSGK
jgi:RepB DNA-primase from phage plasmid